MIDYAEDLLFKNTVSNVETAFLLDFALGSLVDFVLASTSAYS